MSGATEQHEISDQSPYAVHVDALLGCFSTLVEHAQTLAFPPLRKGVTAPPDMTGWSKIRQIAFTISSPLPTTFTAETIDRSLLVLFVWLIISMYWGFAADIVIGHIFGVPQPISPKPEEPLWVEIVAWPLLVLTVILIPMAYWRWIEFFRDRRYPGIWRLILTIGFVGIVISSPYWLLDPEYRVQFPALLLEEQRSLILLITTYLLFVIPTGTSYYTLAIDTLVLSLRLLGVTLKYLQSAHNPLPKELIRKLALEPIPVAESKGKEWRLIELTKAELETLRRWATANREGTDKRLIPTAVLFGVLSVFANTRAFSNVADKVLAWLSDSFVTVVGAKGTPLLPATRRFLALGIVLALGMLFINALLLLFRNLVTQSLIIEACIVAEYACQECQSLDSKGRANVEHKGFWEQFLRLLGKR